MPPRTTNVAEAILAGGRPEAPAVWFGGEVVTYDDAAAAGRLL